LLKKSVFSVIARNVSDEAILNILINIEADCFTSFAMTAQILFQLPVRVKGQELRVKSRHEDNF